MMEILDTQEACQFIEYLMEKEFDDKLFFRWVVGYQQEMPYEDFKMALTPTKVRTEEEILDDVFGIIENVNFEGGELP